MCSLYFVTKSVFPCKVDFVPCYKYYYTTKLPQCQQDGTRIFLVILVGIFVFLTPIYSWNVGILSSNFLSAKPSVFKASEVFKKYEPCYIIIECIFLYQKEEDF